jgi:hypothetical protein
MSHMLNTLVVNTSLIPVYTADLPSLQLTATAIQAQINALMPTASATDQATLTP